MIYLAAALGMIAACAVLHARRAAPWRIYAVATGIFLALGLAGVVLGAGGSGLLWGFSPGAPGYTTFYDAADERRAFHATVVAPLMHLLMQLALPAATCALLYAQERLGAMDMPVLARWLFWPIAAGFFLVPVAMSLAVMNHDAHLHAPGLILQLAESSRRIAWIAFALLGFAGLWSLMRHLTART